MEGAFLDETLGPLLGVLLNSTDDWVPIASGAFGPSPDVSDSSFPHRNVTPGPYFTGRNS